jgi:hypothetical protein
MSTIGTVTTHIHKYYPIRPTISTIVPVTTTHIHKYYFIRPTVSAIAIVTTTHTFINIIP